METSRLTGPLRILAALTVVTSLVAAGVLSRSPWIVAVAAPFLTVLYALGKWRQWRAAWHAGGIKSIALSLLATLPIQLILGYLFYLVGLGLGKLFAPAPMAQLGSGDLVGVAAVFLFCLLCSLTIIRMEGDRSPFEELAQIYQKTAANEEAAASPNGVANGNQYADKDLELDIDPRQLTPATFYLSPGYWKPDVLSEAMEGRGKRIVKRAKAASEADIAAAEARLKVKFPAGLRNLYRIMDGGYVGDMYVALKPDAGPVYDDWRGAFSPDYSQLDSLDRLRFVKDDFDNFDYEPDEIPPNADRLLVLQARTGDVTALDYSQAGEPKVKIFDFGRSIDTPDIEFENFDAFFKALRKPKDEAPRPIAIAVFRSNPLGELPQANHSAAFWNNEPHPFENIAKSNKDGWRPKAKADDVLVSEAEARIGQNLPAALVELYRARNGGSVAYRYLATGPISEIDVFETLAPLEYVVTLEALASRIDFPAGETAWRDRISGADKLVVLNASRMSSGVVLLDYRSGDEPNLLIARNLEDEGLDGAEALGNFDEVLKQLRKWERR